MHVNEQDAIAHMFLQISNSLKTQHAVYLLGVGQQIV